MMDGRESMAFPSHESSSNGNSVYIQSHMVYHHQALPGVLCHISCDIILCGLQFSSLYIISSGRLGLQACRYDSCLFQGCNEAASVLHHAIADGPP